MAAWSVRARWVRKRDGADGLPRRCAAVCMHDAVVMQPCCRSHIERLLCSVLVVFCLRTCAREPREPTRAVRAVLPCHAMGTKPPTQTLGEYAAFLVSQYHWNVPVFSFAERMRYAAGCSKTRLKQQSLLQEP